jgi:PHD/YefM family antitoxin component YafN of YafNO toxin-antitoxin module
MVIFIGIFRNLGIMGDIRSDAMINVTASEFSKNFGRYREVAQREPVAVTSHNRITGYFISGADYEAYLRMKDLQAKTFAVSELSETTIQAIAASTMDARHNHLNSLLDD